MGHFVNIKLHSLFCVVPDVVHLPLEKLGSCLPLDLSCGSEVAAPLASDSTYHNECSKADKEETQMLTHPSRAVPDGRGAPAAAGERDSVTTSAGSIDA